MQRTLVDAIEDIREDEALELAQALLNAGEDPQAVLHAGRKAMAIVRQRHEEKTYYLSELIIAGDILQQMAELVKPKLKGVATKIRPLGTVVI